MTVYPTRTREHYIAALSMNYVERLILLQGHTVEEYRRDYGYDFEMYTYDYQGNNRFESGDFENGVILLQLKSTDNLNILKDGETISLSISRKHIELWRAEPMPVILILYDVAAECAYWLYMQNYLKSPHFHMTVRQNEVAVHIPKSNVLNREAIETFRQYKAEVLQRFGKVSNLHG